MPKRYLQCKILMSFLISVPCYCRAAYGLNVLFIKIIGIGGSFPNSPFMDKIDKTDKVAIKMLKREAMKDVRSTTGANIRGIMLLSGETNIQKVNRDSLNKVEFYKVKNEDKWKVNIAADLLNCREGITEIEGYKQEEMGAVLNSICVS